MHSFFKVASASLLLSAAFAAPALAHTAFASDGVAAMGPILDTAVVLIAQQNQNRGGVSSPQQNREQEQYEGGTESQQQNQGGTQNQEQNRNQNRNGPGEDEGREGITRDEAVQAGAYVCFFSEPLLKGDVICAVPGDAFAELDDAWDDQISSIEIVGTAVRVCTDPDLVGTCRKYSDSASTLPAEMDNANSSFKVGNEL